MLPRSSAARRIRGASVGMTDKEGYSPKIGPPPLFVPLRVKRRRLQKRNEWRPQEHSQEWLCHIGKDCARRCERADVGRSNATPLRGIEARYLG
jgi:hypothetical protein